MLLNKLSLSCIIIVISSTGVNFIDTEHANSSNILGSCKWLSLKFCLFWKKKKKRTVLKFKVSVPIKNFHTWWRNRISKLTLPSVKFIVPSVMVCTLDRKPLWKKNLRKSDINLKMINDKYTLSSKPFEFPSRNIKLSESSYI